MKRSKVKQLNRQAQMVNLMKNAEGVVCACGCPFFDNVKTVKHISALVSPNGQEGYIYMDQMVCMRCLAVLPPPNEYKKPAILKKEILENDKTGAETEQTNNQDIERADGSTNRSSD